MPAFAANARPRLALFATFALTCLSVLPGCRQFQQHRTEIAQLHALGHYQQIAMLLDSAETRKLYGQRSEVLWHLDRGATALALNDTKTTINQLEEAEKVTELRLKRTAGDAAASWLLNDSATAYVVEPYEDLYVNVLKLLAQLEAGNVDGGATVEARRLGTKADVLRERFLKDLAATAAEATRGAATSAPRAAAKSTTSGQFVESPLGLYTSSIAFLKSGNADLAAVAARRLVEVINAQGPLVGPVRADDFRSLESLSPRDVNILAVALSGRGPTKGVDTVGPIPLGTVPIYFELPRLITTPSSIVQARLEFEPRTAGEPRPTDPVSAVRLALVEDLNAVASENHRRALPLIYARTYARVAAKAVASAVVTEGFRKRSSDRDQAGAQIIGVLAGLAVMGATEEADVRCWTMLPGQAHVAAAKLEPGPHRVRIVYESVAGSAIHASAWQNADISEGSLFTIVTHYWN